MNAHPTPKARTCSDCPATILALGNRKRCPTCQDKALEASKVIYKRRKAAMQRAQAQP